MKTLSYHVSDLIKGILFLFIGLICTIFVSCNKDEKCSECPENAQREIVTPSSQTNDTINVINKPATSSDINDETSKSSNHTAKSGAENNVKKATSPNVSDEDDYNVSVINPNDKSNSDSKRTYGSSGTGGGSGTSGSGGDGNGSSGWNSYDKNKKSNSKPKPTLIINQQPKRAYPICRICFFILI